MGATGGFSKTSWGMYADFQEALENLFVAPMQHLNSCYILEQEGEGKSLKFL